MLLLLARIVSTLFPREVSARAFPFPLALTAVTLPTSAGGAGNGAPNRRRNKAGGMPAQAFGMLGKSGLGLTCCKEAEIEADLSDINRGSRRRRTAASGLAGKA